MDVGSCTACDKPVRKLQQKLKCAKCGIVVHRVCSSMSQDEFRALKKDNLVDEWECQYHEGSSVGSPVSPTSSLVTSASSTVTVAGPASSEKSSSGSLVSSDSSLVVSTASQLSDHTLSASTGSSSRTSPSISPGSSSVTTARSSVMTACSSLGDKSTSVTLAPSLSGSNGSSLSSTGSSLTSVSSYRSSVTAAHTVPDACSSVVSSTNGTTLTHTGISHISSTSSLTSATCTRSYTSNSLISSLTNCFSRTSVGSLSSRTGYSVTPSSSLLASNGSSTRITTCSSMASNSTSVTSACTTLTSSVSTRPYTGYRVTTPSSTVISTGNTWTSVSSRPGYRVTTPSSTVTSTGNTLSSVSSRPYSGYTVTSPCSMMTTIGNTRASVSSRSYTGYTVTSPSSLVTSSESTVAPAGLSRPYTGYSVTSSVCSTGCTDSSVSSINSFVSSSISEAVDRIFNSPVETYFVRDKKYNCCEVHGYTAKGPTKNPSIVEMEPAPFYTVQKDLLKLQHLEPNINYGTVRNRAYFFSIDDDVKKVVHSVSRAVAEERYAIILRFCLNDTATFQKDNFPTGLVRVNGKWAQLQPVAIGCKARSVGNAVDITTLCYLDRKNTINIQWSHQSDKSHCFTVQFAEKLTSNDLLRKLKETQYQHSHHTRDLIREKLKADEDNEISTTSLRASLMCPIGHVRMTYPCIGSDCTHVQCVDAMTLLQMNEKKPDWKCLICSTPIPFSKLMINGYFMDILDKVNEEVSEVELSADGSWRVSTAGKETEKDVDKTVNDLSESLHVIDLTESDDENTPPSPVKEVPSKSIEPKTIEKAADHSIGKALHLLAVNSALLNSVNSFNRDITEMSQNNTGDAGSTSSANRDINSPRRVFNRNNNNHSRHHNRRPYERNWNNNNNSPSRWNRYSSRDNYTSNRNFNNRHYNNGRNRFGANSSGQSSSYSNYYSSNRSCGSYNNYWSNYQTNTYYQNQR